MRCAGGGAPDLSLGTRPQVLEPLRSHQPSCPPPAPTRAPPMPWGPGLSPLPLADPRVTLWLPGCASTGVYGDRVFSPLPGWVSVCFKGHAKREEFPLQGSLVQAEDRAGATTWLSHALPGRLAQVPGRTDWSHSLGSLHGHQLPSYPGQPELQSHCQRGEGDSGRTGGGGPWPQLWELRLCIRCSSFHCPGLGRWWWVHSCSRSWGRGAFR